MVFFLPFVTWDQSMKLSGTLSVICVVLDRVIESQKYLIMMAANHFSVR